MNKYASHFFTKIIFLSTLFFSVNAFAFSLGSFLSLFHTPQAARYQESRHHGGHYVEPTHVKVGVYVLHVGKYDLQSANYRMDFYLLFKCKPVCRKLDFEIMNATSSNIHLVTDQDDTLVYRVQADLNKADNLRNYPFDSHALDVIIEDKQMTSDKMIFETDPTITALDSDLSVVGFDLLPTWTAKVTNHFYTVFQKTFSSYKFSMIIKRPCLAGILKGILPALIIICCNFLALFMKIDHTSQRLGIATSTLIAAEVFHLNLTSSLPPLGYITYADMFMFINYLYLLIVLIEVVVTTYFIETKHHALAERINTLCAWSIPIFWLVLQAINWLIFNPTSIVSNAN